MKSPRSHTSAKEELAWLKTQPDLAAMRARHPQHWAAVETALAGILERKDPEALQAFLATGGLTSHSRQPDAQINAAIRARMAQLAMKSHFLRAATGVKTGKIRFNWFNGFVAQRLLFARKLERKPVSLTWFRLLWPLLWQRKRLMALVEPRGIYCFYSRELVTALAHLIDGRPCLEIAAGDGTLSHFLKDAGVTIQASDDQSWAHAITYPDWLEKRDAAEALQVHQPKVVLCSWPPAGNPFESAVFRTASVDCYVVIGSRQTFGFGNWTAYRQQTAFEFAEDPGLSRLVLPPELEPAVYVFRRKEAA